MVDSNFPLYFRTDQTRMEYPLHQVHVPSTQPKPKVTTTCPLRLQQQLLLQSGTRCHSCFQDSCRQQVDLRHDSRSMLILHNRHRSAVRLKKKLNQVCCPCWWQQLPSALFKAFLPSRPSTALLYNFHLMGAVIFLLLAIQPCQGKTFSQNP